MSFIDRMSNKIEDEYSSEETETKNVGEQDFGSGYFILNVDKKELYEFLKANMPAGYIHETFEEFEQNLKVNHFVEDDLNEIGLDYTVMENFVISMVDNFIYVPSIEGFDYFSHFKNEQELLKSYQRFIASKFPEFKQNYLKRIIQSKRHYMRYYGEECKRAYKIYKTNMDALNKQYKEIFDEDCPVFRK